MNLVRGTMNFQSIFFSVICLKKSHSIKHGYGIFPEIKLGKGCEREFEQKNLKKEENNALLIYKSESP